MTVLELMIVLAIIASAFVLVRSGFRMITKADLVENSTELSAVMRRASQLAVSHGELHRVVLDLDHQAYIVETCEGQVAITRNELVRGNEEEQKRALDRVKDRMAGLTGSDDMSQAPDPDEATKQAFALAGHHIADRTCMPATDSVTGDATGKKWVRKLNADKGIKFKEVWVQHRDESVTKGQVAIYFFPNGSSEKAVVELTDGGDTFSVLVYGLTGRVELKDGVLRDVNEHMMRNAMGDHDAQREDSK